MEVAHRAGDERLGVLVQAFMAVARLAAGGHDEARTVVESLDRAASDDGYDRFITHWVGWMLAIYDRDASSAQRWMDAQQDFLDRTEVKETWLSAFSKTMTQVVTGGDFQNLLRRTLALADREGYRVEGDCVLILAYADICEGRFEQAAELMGTAVASRFNTTAHYTFYRVVLDQWIRRRLDPAVARAAMERGRRRIAAEVLAEVAAEA
jgi:hypothetical protein